MRVALRGPDGDLRSRRDLLERQVERVLQHDDVTLRRRDLRERASELIPQADDIGTLWRCVYIVQEEFVLPRLLPLRDVAARVDGEAVQPRRELRLAAKLLDPLTELRKRLLRCILRVFSIGQQVPCQALDAWRMTYAERLKGVLVAVLCTCDQDGIAESLVDDRGLGPKLTLDSTAVTRKGLHGDA